PEAVARPHPRPPNPAVNRSYGTRSTGRSRFDRPLDRGLDPGDGDRTSPGLELERIDLPEHEAQRAEDGGPIAELASDDLGGRRGHRERAAFDRGADRVQQDVAGSAQRTPDDHPARVQEVAEVGDLHADQPSRVADHTAATRVAGRRQPEQIVHRQVPVAPAQALQERRGPDEPFETAAIATPTDGTI